jgi:hypothetical protein
VQLALSEQEVRFRDAIRDIRYDRPPVSAGGGEK